ncbi:putative membrane protein [Nocardia nova SH22a]|uniref:Putative membrane protein n=1 Tax=Nocardia nova SH22a TaxID=1415166 RepID=W5TQW1_9NOCA|nr:FUSC family protein [Nocardia nova]AHH21514.1 putative membrane protein [Nocardia nova SH22a]
MPHPTALSPAGIRHASRVLSLRGVFRMRPVADTWYQSALCAVIAIGVPEIVLLATGQVQLAFYTSAGGLCAVYAHGMPYAARARTLAWVVAGMVTGTAVALIASALIDSAFLRVAVIAVLAGLYKLICDASRMGPPGNIIFTFVVSSAAFVPQRAGQLPGHIGLILLGGVLAWCVCMAPALVRPHGPQRMAVARAVEAVARLLRVPVGDPGLARARHDAAVAVQAGWNALARVPSTTRTVPQLTALAGLLARAETLAATTRPSGRPDTLHPAVDGTVADRNSDAGRPTARDGLPVRPDGMAPGRDRIADSPHGLVAAPDPAETAAGAESLERYGRELRRGRPVPRIARVAAEESEIRGIALGRPSTPRGTAVRRVLRSFRPGAAELPLAARVTVGSAAAGWISLALGVDRPYWAVMTAAVLIVANTALSWQRTVQRVLGNLVGVGLFAAAAPWIHSPVTLVALALTCQVVVEATISRNYWVASVFITPMALAMVEFANPRPAAELGMDRWLDTCVGAVVAVVICFVIPNRRVADRVATALRDLDTAIGGARRAVESGRGDGSDRARLAAALIEVRTSADTAAGEWWSGPLPDERIVATERVGHQLLDRLPVRSLATVAA